jgi:hypothetical protein
LVAADLGRRFFIEVSLPEALASRFGPGGLKRKAERLVDYDRLLASLLKHRGKRKSLAEEAQAGSGARRVLESVQNRFGPNKCDANIGKFSGH